MEPHISGLPEVLKLNLFEIKFLLPSQPVFPNSINPPFWRKSRNSHTYWLLSCGQLYQVRIIIIIIQLTENSILWDYLQKVLLRNFTLHSLSIVLQPRCWGRVPWYNCCRVHLTYLYIYIIYFNVTNIKFTSQ